jgi:hypothetical protein
MKRSKHSLSHYKLLTCDMGQLVPVGCVEVLPGDTFQHSASTLLRVSPLVAPTMHPVTVRLHHFFVPNRIIWSGWEDFITGGPDGNDTSTVPTVSHTATPANEPLLDYLGVPPVASLSGINALPVRAYNKIYNEYFRDEDLVTAVSEDNMDLHRVSWEKDYFTGSRPWTQKGDAVTIPTSGLAPVTGLGISGSGFASTSVGVTESDGSTPTYANAEPLATGNFYVEESATNNQPNVFADIAQAAMDVNDFRLGFALQRYKEARAKYGSRYVEYLRYCGINPSDARLQRPEYLGGGRQTIAFSEVLQTAEGTDPVGDMKGHGIAALRSNRYRKFFEEHGWVLTLMSVRPKAMYVDALPRKFSRQDKEDFHQKELELIGQQAVLNKEIYAPNTTTPDDVFGYNDRYNEYRSEPSLVAGEFRTTLNHFHLARDLSSQPTLNQSFIDCNPSKRIHADTSSHQLWCMVNHSLQARRTLRRNAYNRII